ICNNSGGALVRRGPAYTELALYARVKDDGTLELVNHLGIALGDTPEEILTRLQNGDYAEADVQRDTGRAASDARYAGADAQRRYDIAYQQCMYAKGNQLPGAYGYGSYRPASPYGTPPPAYPSGQPGYSIPPPNYPPPPPLRRE
ncbi:MAG TPA: hypothetical protein PK229_16020, partial [Rhodocyclaceae bacterium]|nr:hypothetical protein [Rhodocyclaceae bacterium]